MQINKAYPCKNTNYRKGRRDSIKYIVIHYVGATGNALNNVQYYGSANVGASAHYYVGHASEDGAVYQSVAPENCAWHCGSEMGIYYHPCRNDSSIGIEMCCHKDSSGNWYFDDVTVEKTIELTKWLMGEYGISANNVIRHYDVTHKSCPAPFVVNEEAWKDFKSRFESVSEYTDINDIVSELGNRGIVTDTEGMKAQMRAEPDGRLYWLGRKIVQYIRTHEGEVRRDLKEYENVHDIVWDLSYRSIVSDADGLEEELSKNPDSRLYWLARKGLTYIRLRD